jgi:hypothetical protein
VGAWIKSARDVVETEMGVDHELKNVLAHSLLQLQFGLASQFLPERRFFTGLLGSWLRAEHVEL